ncbi:restriction endonuclease subunit S [Candidatus Woesearchaeota archaeon]|nr:restriction endonuclease subunit S [Candidatus Woesearchaeota archaeon]
MNTSISFQNSNIDWVGSIPSSWEMKKGKYLFSNKKEINSENQCDNLLSLTLFGVLNKDMESSEGLRPLNYKTYQIFEKNDMVFKLIDLENKKTSRVGLVHEKGIMSPVYIRLIPKENSLPKYFYYQYYDLYKKYIFNYLGSGVRSSLNPTDLMEIPLVFPPLPEQTQIVSFLDTKTQKIDELVEKTEQKIKLLKEKRTSLINHCVTKGLNPDVKMKDSGVEWIGEIPRDWKLLKFWLIISSSDLGGNYNCSSEYEGYPVMKMGNLGRGSINLKKIEYIDNNSNVDKNHILQNGDFLFNTRNSKELVGKVSLWKNELPISIYNSNILRICFNKNVSNDYMNYLFNSNSILDVLKMISKGTTNVSGIYFKDLSNIYICLPSKHEQTQIVEYLDEQTQNIDSTIEKETQRIELLKEYRQSLISEVVTGKVDVRDWKE